MTNTGILSIIMCLGVPTLASAAPPLPTPLVAATAALFGEGLADPIGGEYRTITIQYGDPHAQDAGRITAHGWVMPTGTPDGPRSVVCWNGLVYPLVSVGGPADLNADVHALVDGGGMYPLFASEDASDWVSLKETTPSPLKVCLLVRLGQDILARQLWDAQTTPPPALFKRLHLSLPPPGTGPSRDPYREPAADWAWALASRAIREHHSGDDKRSLADLRQLTALRPVIEAEAARRGDKGGEPSFGFLDVVPRLLADETRRVAETSPPPALPDILALRDKPARIAALIASLDQVSVEQTMNPGGVEPDGDPIVAALIAQDDAAVQPLIDTVKADQRLTRSVAWPRGGQFGAPLSVAGAAFAGLEDILHTSEFSAAPEDLSDRAKTAAALQSYWDRFKGLPLMERWYRTLADDAAGTAQWREAAHEIVRPGGEGVRAGWIEPAPRGPTGMTGEPLRHGHAPSVSALMARRVAVLDARSVGLKNDSRQVNDVGDADTMALYLAGWDPEAARPVLRSQFLTERRTMDAWNGKIDLQSDVHALVDMTLARMQIGDPTALADYAAWICGAALKDLPSFGYSDLFEPLWRVPENPISVQTAAFLFTDPHSPWVPLIRERPGLSQDTFADLLESPLVCLPVFRRAMLAALTDRTVVQTVTLGGPDRNVDFALTRSAPDPFRPATPTVFPVRRCDLYAWHLSHIGGMPAFAYDWPEAKKNEAVAEAAACLRRYGPNLSVALAPVFPGVLPGEGGRRTTPPGLLPVEGGDDFTPAPYLRFPHLRHPANGRDVAENRAIFSLGGQGIAPKGPAFPLAARWVTGHGAQDGTVWQGEETATGGRFYGFVGPHDIAAVPADQIEFPAADIWDWRSIATGLDCALCDPSGRPVANPQVLPVGQPLALTVRLRSRSGVSRSVPTDFLRDGPGRPSLRRGVTMTLLYSPADAALDLQQLYAVAGDPRRVWEPLPPHPSGAFDSTRARALSPTEEDTAFVFDPHAWFDMTRPGLYRLRVAFADGSVGSGGGLSRELVLQVTPPRP